MTLALSPAYDPRAWSTFFTLTGTAAATLTGLFFVAVSLRVRELQLSLVLRTRARYLLIWLIAGSSPEPGRSSTSTPRPMRG